MTLNKISNGIYVSPEYHKKYDGIIFDCDGVLIDITKSYDSTIIQTTKYILNTIAKIDSIPVNHKIIDGFKATGRFNDEVDLTFAAIISLVAADKLKRDPNIFIFDVIKNATGGIDSVESFLDSLTDISEIKHKLDYPGTHKDNLLYQIFDQMFYGPQLYQKLFAKTSRFSEPGLIEQDDVILDHKLLYTLEKRFGTKIAMVTGRGYESVLYSLGKMLEKFDLKNSFFLEDESRDLAKPNPKPLLNCISGINATSVLYVGDSMEDLIMAKKVSELGQKVTFCGIIGTSKSPDKKLELFEQNGAMLVLDSIKLLPKVLNLENSR